MANKLRRHLAIRPYFNGDKVWWEWACKCGASDLKTKGARLRDVDCQRCLRAVNGAMPVYDEPAQSEESNESK